MSRARGLIERDFIVSLQAFQGEGRKEGVRKWNRADETKPSGFGIIEKGWYGGGDIFKKGLIEASNKFRALHPDAPPVLPLENLQVQIAQMRHDGHPKFSLATYVSVGGNHWVAVTLNIDLSKTPGEITPTIFNSIDKDGKLYTLNGEVIYNKARGSKEFTTQDLPKLINITGIDGLTINPPQVFDKGVRQVNSNDCGPLSIINSVAAAFDADPCEILPGKGTLIPHIAGEKIVPETITDLLRFEQQVGFSLEAYQTATAGQISEITLKLNQLRDYENSLLHSADKAERDIGIINARIKVIGVSPLSATAELQDEYATLDLAKTQHLLDRETARRKLEKIGHPTRTLQRAAYDDTLPDEIQAIITARDNSDASKLLWKTIEATLYEPKLLDNITAIERATPQISVPLREKTPEAVPEASQTAEQIYNQLRAELCEKLFDDSPGVKPSSSKLFEEFLQGANQLTKPDVNFHNHMMNNLVLIQSTLKDKDAEKVGLDFLLSTDFQKLGAKAYTSIPEAQAWPVPKMQTPPLPTEQPKQIATAQSPYMIIRALSWLISKVTSLFSSNSVRITAFERDSTDTDRARPEIHTNKPDLTVLPTPKQLVIPNTPPYSRKSSRWP